MLKQDYKDAMYDGQRRYRLVQNDDGTCSMVDATIYTQVGDKFGGNDINNTNSAVNRLSSTVLVLLPVSGWAGAAAPYTITINVPGATADSEPLLVSALSDGATADAQKAYNKAYGIISAGTGTCGNGTATFKVYKKPAIDITVGLKGV